MTKRTAISLPDDLFREIERARKRSRKDRSSWIQEAATEYLKHRSKEEEIEAYFAAYERIPPNEDELSLERWKEEHLAELFADADVTERSEKGRRC